MNARLTVPVRVAVLAAVLLAGTSPGVGSQVATPAAGAPVAVVAGGLVNPRGFAWDEDGTLHVALGGARGVGSGVVAIEDGCPRAVVDGLPVARVTFRAIAGVADVAFLGGELYALLAGSDIDGGGRPNGLYRVAGNEAELVADLSTFIRDNPVAEVPGDYDTDGQPYALLPVGEDAFWVTEGNSNQLFRVGLDGSVGRVVDLSRGHPIPTGIAPAPEGGAYVALFSRIPYPEGGAKVILVGEDGTTSDFWTGLTVPTALAVGPDGALYAAEMATGYGADPNTIRPGTGRVVRRTGPDTLEEVVTGLGLPTALDFGPDGALYVAGPAFGADSGEGTIARFDLGAGRVLDAGEAEPAAPCGA